MRLLIVKLGAIGDIVHSLPALHQIRLQMPDVFIGWAAEKRSAEILRGNPLIDRLIEIDTKSVRKQLSPGTNLPDIKRQLTELRTPGFDISIDMQGLLKSAAIAKLSGAKKRWGFSRSSLREPASRILLTNTVEITEHTHIIKKNLELVDHALGLHDLWPKVVFPIFTREEHKQEASQLLDRINGKFVILNPAGGWPTKLWPAENYGRLADRVFNELGLIPVITSGPGEEILVERALNASQSAKIVAVKPSLKGFYELARKAALYVGGDTGPTHIAAAAGTPIVALFGPTEWWRNGSLDPADICVERNDISCRVNCHRRSCSAWICMNISTDEVFSAITERLAKTELKASI